MNDSAVLSALLDRLAVANGDAACFAAQELAEWPPTVLNRIRTAGLLAPSTPASSVICPGCEMECAMPVELTTNVAGTPRAFIACDKRDDTARVPVPLALLEQWQCTPRQLADAMATLLGLQRPNFDADSKRLDLGIFKGKKYSAHLVLNIDGGMQIAIAGHLMAVADVLSLGDQGLIVDRNALVRCVDSPVAAAGDKVSREHRVERLRKRRNELKAAGVRNFNEVMADEEGCSRSAIKQLLAEKQAPKNWLDLPPVLNRTVSKKPKPSY